MPRIDPLPRAASTPAAQIAFEQHLADYPGSRITNMKATLAHEPLAFEVYMQWYPLYAQVQAILGERLAYLYAHAISEGSDCPLCTTFFRKIIIEYGERPEALALAPHEQLLLRFGSQMAQHKGELPDDLYAEVRAAHSPRDIVVLVAFAGQMIATNIFNNALQVDIDEYLYPYLPLTAPNTP